MRRLMLVAFAGTLSCKMQEEPRKEVGVAVSRPEHLLWVKAPAGDVPSLVRAELGKAEREKRRLLVYVGGESCEPCRRFHKASEAGELDKEFSRLTLLEFDAEADHERLRAAGYVSRYIPLFVAPKSDGTSSGLQIEGGTKGGDPKTDIAPRLSSLLARTKS